MAADEVRRVKISGSAAANGSGGGGSVQSSLTEATFAEYLEGYEPTTPEELLEVSGGRVRYAIDTLRGRGSGSRVESTLFRLGGILTSVDREVFPPRYLRLLNPYANGGRGAAWSVQLEQAPGKRTRLWYAPPVTDGGGIHAMRDLLKKLESGEIRVTKVPE